MTALGHGGFHPTDMPSLVEWDISGRCERPASRMLHARDETKLMTKTLINPGSMSLLLHAPCRKCGPCLLVKRLQWQSRAQTELALSRRTWFATFTMSPEEHYMSWMRICVEQRKRNCGSLPDFDFLEAYALRCTDFGKLLTKYLKRLRKNNPTISLRYLLVSEAHKNGYPHFHALLHERSDPVTHRALTEEWPHGFSTFKLVENAAAGRYVTKYISKDASARVRASLHYGKSYDGLRHSSRKA